MSDSQPADNQTPRTDDASPAAPATTSLQDAGSTAQSAPQRPSRVREVTTRSLSEFTTTKHLVTVMMDAITAHKSLYELGGVLHGDVNNNTIIILDYPHGETKGALVDFDLPYAMPAIRKIGDPDPVAPPPQRHRPYYWRAPGV